MRVRPELEGPFSGSTGFLPDARDWSAGGSPWHCAAARPCTPALGPEASSRDTEGLAPTTWENAPEPGGSWAKPTEAVRTPGPGRCRTVREAARHACRARLPMDKSSER